MMTIKTFIFSPFQENTYLVYDETNEAVIIDPGCYNDTEKQILKQYIEAHELQVKRLLNTHLHIDHQFGNRFVAETYNLLPEVCKEDEFLLERIESQYQMFGLQMEGIAQKLGEYIVENQLINFGNSEFIALHVPGHSPGSMAFYSKNDAVVFAGDVLFQGSIGRTDLPKGDYGQLISSIQNKLLPLPDSTVVYSGHGPSTTIGYEKLNNPYL